MPPNVGDVASIRAIAVYLPHPMWYPTRDARFTANYHCCKNVATLVGSFKHTLECVTFIVHPSTVGEHQLSLIREHTTMPNILRDVTLVQYATACPGVYY
jgi:hypothetical protein